MVSQCITDAKDSFIHLLNTGICINLFFLVFLAHGTYTPKYEKSVLLLKSQVSVTMTRGVSVVGVAGWPVILTDWPAAGTGARVLGVVTGISAASTGGVLDV